MSKWIGLGFYVTAALIWSIVVVKVFGWEITSWEYWAMFGTTITYSVLNMAGRDFLFGRFDP